MKCAYKQEMDKRDISTCGRMFVSFMDLAAGVVLHKELGFGKTRLQKFYNESFDEMMYSINKYGTTSDNDRDQVADGLIGTKTNLKYYEIDIDAWEGEVRGGRKYRIYQRPRLKKLVNARIDFIEHAYMIDVAYNVASIKWLHDACGFGSKRCKPIYLALREEYEHFVDLFLMCSQQADREMDNIMKEYRDKLTGIGLELEHGGASYFA